MTDVVYILGHQNEYEELRYSLRSLRFFPHDGNVWIVGAPPPVWSQNLNWLPVEQQPRYEDKRWNQRNNIYQACLHPDISDEFVLMNDDFIFLTNIGPRPPIVHQGPIPEFYGYRDRHPNGYHDAYEYLIQNDYPNPLVYAEHRPMVMRKDVMARVHELCQHIDTYPVPTLYGNIAGLADEAEWGEDAVMRRGLIWEEDEWQVSTFENDFPVKPYGQLIRFMHPDPSPYEKS